MQAKIDAEKSMKSAQKCIVWPCWAASEIEKKAMTVALKNVPMYIIRT